MTEYPFLIYNLTGEFLLTKQLHLNPPPSDEPRAGIIVETEAEIFDEFGNITEYARTEFERFAFGEELRTNMKVGVVFGPNDASYFDDNGHAIRSDFVPRLETNYLVEEPDEETLKKLNAFLYGKVIRPERLARGPLRVQKTSEVIL